MVKCINCGNPIDMSNPKEIFYTRSVGNYECGKCHNADLNLDYDKNSNKLSITEIFVLVLGIIVIALIIYLVLF